MINDISQTITDFLATFNIDLTNPFQQNLLYTLLIIIGLVLTRWLVIRIIHRRYTENTRTLYNLRKTVEYASVILGILLVGRLWLAGIGTLVTYLGLLSAGIAIALQDLIVALAGWMFIVWRRPFVVGDRIEIDEHAGDVIDIRLFSFSMLEIGRRIKAEQSTGRIIHIPNGKIFTEVLTNMHQGFPFIWNEIPVMVSFESDWEKAKAILVNIINDLAPDVSEAVRKARRSGQRFVISYSNLSPTVYTSVADSGVVLTLRYMVDPRQRRGSEQDIWEAILRAFKHHWNIDFAYPTQREYLHFEEGKKPPNPQEMTTVVAEHRQLQRDTGYRPTKPKESEE
ncbi:MAG: mechanosensitive ion channel family protein [Ardenticatenaceae bacterium]|nr:mechanosensitive ion channel family protein [Anaerolineales bacterium]MCB8938269.1 mechanosensitive ion channel family protein [Ardenticatenaceae bacterium]MCB8975634.1 mechanosensitive ion channel family protein [Ardenticatenaceae bacterium]